MVYLFMVQVRYGVVQVMVTLLPLLIPTINMPGGEVGMESDVIVQWLDMEG